MIWIMKSFKYICVLITLPFLISCASKIPITKIPTEDVRRIEQSTHAVDFERLSHSIPKGTLIESVQGGAFCEVQQNWAMGGMDNYSRGPGTALYNTQAENDVMGLKRTDMNFLAFKTMEDTLKQNNIKISANSDLKLSALITDTKINTCLAPYVWSQKGEAYFKINWKLYSKTLKKDLYDNSFESYTEELEFGDKNVEKMLIDVHIANVIKLINDEKFRKLIDSNNLYIGTNENSI
jgi:hypothetical protein